MGKQLQAKRLTKKELDALKDLMRMWPHMQRAEAAKLIYHIESLRLDIERLENSLYELEQKHFFNEVENLKNPQPKPQPTESHERVSVPLRQRLYTMDKEGKKGTKEWDATVRWNGLTEAQIKALIESVEVSDTDQKRA